MQEGILHNQCENRYLIGKQQQDTVLCNLSAIIAQGKILVTNNQPSAIASVFNLSLLSTALASYFIINC